MEFRIGINLGDVMVDGEQIYGDGVNIAARLEALAEAGGICISGVVHDQVKNKLALTYEDLGAQAVKNIAEPVRVWRVVMGEAATTLAEQVMQRQAQSGVRSPASPKSRVGTAHRSWAVGIVASLLFIVGTIVAIRYLARPPLSTQDSALRTEAAPAALPLPDKPSIVVLPFLNMSGDPEQEYFSDGLTEVLTSNLSQISSLFIIARNSAFFYKSKGVKVQDISRELGVRYVLEGSVQKAGERVRIVAQLVDATTGGHLWSERYDRPLKDIFAVQDEIVQKIVTTLKLQLLLREQGVLARKTTDNLEAYDLYLRGVDSWFRAVYETKKEANEQARQLLERAVALDSAYAEAYWRLGYSYILDLQRFWSQDPGQSVERAGELAQRVTALDDSLSGGHTLLSWVSLYKRQYDRAIVEVERAIALDPNNDVAYSQLANILVYAGRPEETRSSQIVCK
jgi:TolB-like protein